MINRTGLCCALALLFAAALPAAVRDAFWSLEAREPVYAGQRVQLLLNVDLDPNEEIGNFSFRSSPLQNQPLAVEQGHILARQSLKNDADEPFARIRIRFDALLTAAGDVALPATRVTAARTVLRQDTFGFPFPRLEAFEFDLRPFTFTVSPLPEDGKPDGFSGAVGHYRIVGSATPNTLAPGAVTTVRLVIETQNGIIPEAVTPEPALDPALFRVYPVKVLQREPQRVTTETLVVPLTEAATNLTSTAFSWFDPITQRYRQAQAALQPLTVKAEAREVLPALRVIEAPETAHTAEGAAPGGLAVKEETPLRFGPSERSPILFRLAAGEGITLLEQHEGWSRVDAAGRRGWIQNFHFETGE